MNIIKEKMDAMGLGKGQLMDVLGVKAKQTIDKYLNDPMTMSGYQIKEVCNVLNIDVERIFEERK